MARKPGPDSVREIAERAEEMALSLQCSNSVQAMLLETTLRFLLEKGALSKPDLEQIFYHCYATTVQTAEDSSMRDHPVTVAMLDILRQVASGAFQIDLEAIARKNPPQRN